MQDFLNKNILLGVCGGIAAYKSAQLVRELTQLGANVRVVMTQSAQQFITPMTFQALSGNTVRTELWDDDAERAMGHIELARWADALLIAPATANTIAKLTQGFADDLLTTLALVTSAPILICPAMNHSMWLHPATQNNCQTLAERGVIIVGPEKGDQACGENGPGRLAETTHIINALRLVGIKDKLEGETVVITAGPTQEAIDPVRYLTNRSSGKMGFALAHACAAAGAKVILISGPTALKAPPNVSIYLVHSANEMHHTVMKQLKPQCIFIGCAAVSDYSIDDPSSQKIKKQDHQALTLKLKKNPDILADVAKQGCTKLTIGFAAETQNVTDYATTKMLEKKLDMIIANQVGATQGFDTDDNQLTVITPDTTKILSAKHKTRLAGELVAIIAATLA